jgi:zinc ribbon protein
VCAKCGRPLSPTAKFCPECAHPTGLPAAPPPKQRFDSPESYTYTPKHLAEKILMSKSALEGERKQVTVLFADLKGSMELLADRDPEDARRILDPVLERMMEAVHRYEGTVNQVMGDGIMALFGASGRRWPMRITRCARAMPPCECKRRLRRGGSADTGPPPSHPDRAELGPGGCAISRATLGPGGAILRSCPSGSPKWRNPHPPGASRALLARAGG